MFEVKRYHNWKTGRTRWAAYDTKTRQWILTRKTGKEISQALATKLNQLSADVSSAQIKKLLAGLDIRMLAYGECDDEYIPERKLQVSRRSNTSVQD